MKVEKTTVEREVEKTITVTESEDVITVQFNEEEVCALIAVFGKLSDWRNDNNVRVVTDALWSELCKASGINWTDQRVKRFAQHLHGTWSVSG